MSMIYLVAAAKPPDIKKGSFEMKKYRKFYINTEAYVVFTENEKQYIRKLVAKNGKSYIRFNNQTVEIPQDHIYM